MFGGDVDDNDISNAHAAFESANLLFDDEVCIFLNDVLGRVTDYSYLMKDRSLGELILRSEEARQEDEKKTSDFNRWISDQYENGVELFDKHMKI